MSDHEKHGRNEGLSSSFAIFMNLVEIFEEEFFVNSILVINNQPYVNQRKPSTKYEEEATNWCSDQRKPNFIIF